MRLGPGNDGCVDDDTGAYFDRASTYGLDQVDGDAQVKWEETGKASVDHARADRVDNNHVASDEPG